MSDQDTEKLHDVESAGNDEAESKASNVVKNDVPETITETNGKKHFHLGDYDISVSSN